MLVWDLATGLLRARLEGHKGMVRALAFAPDGATLADRWRGRRGKLWDLKTNQLRATLSGHSDMVTCLAFSPGGEILATGSLDATVKLWETSSGRERASLQGHLDGVSALAFAPDARQMATAGLRRLRSPLGARRPDLLSNRLPLVSRRAGQSGLRARRPVRCERQARRVSSGGTWRPARHCRLRGKMTRRSGRATKSWCLTAEATSGFPPPTGTTATCERFRPTAVFSRPPDRAATWCSGTREAAGSSALLKGHRDEVSQVVFSPDGACLATAGKDRTVKLWNLATRRQTARATLKGDLTPVWSVAYSPDGKTLAVADGPTDTPGTVTLWDAGNQEGEGDA